MPNFLKKILMTQESYTGNQSLSFLDFRGKIVAALLLLAMGVLFQVWLGWKNFANLHEKINLTRTAISQIENLNRLEKMGTEIPAKSVVAVRKNTTLDLGDRIRQMNQLMEKLNGEMLGNHLDQLKQRFRALVTQINYYQIFNMNEQQYGELRLIYQRYYQTLTAAENEVNSFYSKNISALSSRIVWFIVDFIILIVLIVISGWCFLVAIQSIITPANLMMQFFQTDFSERGDYQLPVYSSEGLGLAAIRINQSFAKGNEIFTQVKRYLIQFERLSEELITEFRNQEPSQGQLYEIHKIINNYLEEQSETVKNINEQLTFLVSNLATMQRIPFQLVQKSEKIDHLLFINQNKLAETVNQPLEIVDDSKPFLPLFQELTGSANQIKNVTVILGEIAEHTELLAFNTAIEAARAGTKGLGFSVVSKEITKLVERSKQAALDLTANVKDFQTKTDLIIKLLPKTTITEDTIARIRQKTAEICSNVQNTVRDSVNNLRDLAQALEDIYSKTSQISQEAKLTSDFSFAEKEDLKQIENGILDYQVSMKDAAHLAEQIKGATEKLGVILRPPKSEVVPPQSEVVSPEPEPIG